MVLPLHMSNDESSAYRSRTVRGHRGMTSCSYRIHCKTCHRTTIISKHVTNSLGAAKELKAFLGEWEKLILRVIYTEKDRLEIQLSRSPKIGGICKRLVQSSKKVMIAILYNVRDVILSTTMCLVEQNLHARPPKAVDDIAVLTPNPLTVLTPDHLVLGQESASAPVMPSSERYRDPRKSFKTAQLYADIIWKTWTRGYLPQCNQKLKWSIGVRILKEGQLVWMIDDSLKRSKYKMGRVIQVFKGDDGVIQSARIKMAHGENNRSVLKLAHNFTMVFQRLKTEPATVVSIISIIPLPINTSVSVESNVYRAVLMLLEPLQICNMSHQKAGNNLKLTKNLGFFKTQKGSKLKSFTSWDQNFIKLQFWEGKPQQPESMAHG